VSSADASFTVTKDPRGDTLRRGTEVKLFLKEDAGEFLDQSRLEELIKRYSEFVTFDIKLWASEEKTVEVIDEDDEEEGVEDEDEETEDDDDEEEYDEPEDDKPLTKTVTEWDWKLINNQAAIWTRDSKDVTDEEYTNFYKGMSKDTEDPATWIHFKAEGEVEFKSILFIPSVAPWDLYDQYYQKSAQLKLYVRKVLITDEFEDLVPRYLNFLRGIVDSDDLPLNVSRETLQQHKVLKVMGKKLVRKALEMLRKLAAKKEEAETDEDEETEEDEDGEGAAEVDDPYVKFWEAFGKNIKLGIIEDSANRSKLTKLLRYKTNKSGDKFISLEEYVDRMADWQTNIYFISGENQDVVEKSPFLEKINKKGVECLYLTDPIDEYTVQHITEYDGKKLQSVTKEGLKFGDEDDKLTKAREQAYKDKYKPLVDYLKTTYGEKISKVTVSQRVETTPCVIVTSQFGNSANMERIMRAQAFADPTRNNFMNSPKTMELNPRHPIVAELMSLSQSSPDDQHTKDVAWMLFETASMASGFPTDDVDSFSGRMYRVLSSGMKLESSELLEEIEVDLTEDEDAEDAEDGDDFEDIDGSEDEL
jgi:heat shock protein beta